MVVSPKHRRSNYRILGLVGHGQFGRVYCAVHRTKGHLVAVKLLNRQRLPTHTFLQELHCMLRLNHPNIVTCEALEHTRDGRQLILEYCEAGTLRALMDTSPQLALDRVLTLARQITGGLAHAHEQGIIHCDIKPENILLQYRQGQPVAKISDFGIAKVAQSLKSVSSGQTGSPAYMAPERFYKQFSTASDVYAVGILLYELIAGRRPFSGTPLELMTAHLNQPVPVPEQLVEPLKTVVLKALAKIPARRYPSAVEMLTALQNLDMLQSAPSLQLDAPELLHQPFVGDAIAPLRHPIRQFLFPAPGSSILLGRSDQHLMRYAWDPPTVTEQAVVDTVAQTTGLYATPHGPCLTTESGLMAIDLARAPNGQRWLQPVARWGGDTLAALATNGRWYGAISPDRWQLTIGPLWRQGRWAHPTDQPWQQRSLSLPRGAVLEAAFPADSDHLVVVERQPSGMLSLHVFARKGLYLGALPVELPLKSLMPTLHPYRFLALETETPSLVRVDLKPFRMMRVELDIVPHLAAVMPWGYVVLSRSGQLLVLDRETAPIGCIEVPAQATALYPVSPHALLLATWSGSAGGLYPLDLRQFDLDILF
ncbi:MAG: serine/threonine-protein kinase [Cyanobacteria bacterium J06629_9]